MGWDGIGGIGLDRVGLGGKHFVFFCTKLGHGVTWLF